MNKNLENTKKLIILAFEGPDKVGKSTLIREVNKRTNYKYLCVDRFLASAWVYDSLYGRRNREMSLHLAEKELSTLEYILVINIILKSNKEVLQKRILLEDESSKERIYTLNRAVELYNKYSKQKSMFPILEIDTTHKTVDETVNEILSGINKYD